METSDEQGFHRAMISIYNRAKRDLGYNTSRFLQMLDQGGLAAARQLLHAPLSRTASPRFGSATGSISPSRLMCSSPSSGISSVRTSWRSHETGSTK
jgi:hypothetical protein